MVGTGYLFICLLFFFDLLLIIIIHILYINAPYKWHIINNLNKQWNKIYKIKRLRD